MSALPQRSKAKMKVIRLPGLASPPLPAVGQVCSKGDGATTRTNLQEAQRQCSFKIFMEGFFFFFSSTHSLILFPSLPFNLI